MKNKIPEINLEHLKPIHITLIILSIISAYIHLDLGIAIGITDPLGFSFILATIGFITGIYLITANKHLDYVYLLGIPFILIQIIAWIILNNITLDMIPQAIGNMELIDKTAQTIILAILTYQVIKKKR